MDKPLVQAENVHKFFYRREQNLFRKERFAALSGINFKIYTGETLGIVGESGSGKSTLARLLARLFLPDAGYIFYQGTDYRTFSRSFWASRLQLVFQESAMVLNPKLTVNRNLREILPDDQIIEELFERNGLSANLLRLYPYQLSGGERQRVGIVRALLRRPEILVLDEPVSSLDVSLQSQVLNLLCELKETYNLTYIFVSHDLNVVSYLANRVMVISAGQVIEEGTNEEIFLQPRMEYTRKLIALRATFSSHTLE